jgi:precorrin-3B C17-methyltransferase
LNGSLAIVGLGPGPARWMTPEAMSFIEAATDVVGYEKYLDRIPHRQNLIRHASGNGIEQERALVALRLANLGRHVVVVSGGDPGIFAMAASVFEAIETGDPTWRTLDVTVVPGISAMHAVAARLGAPLGHDFCAISLSDILKPWTVIERRLIAAADGDFVIALYNPASKRRRHQIHQAFSLLRSRKDLATPVTIARSVGHENEQIIHATLADIDLEQVDMSSLVLIGSSQTRIIQRSGNSRWLLTPRHYSEVR